MRIMQIVSGTAVNGAAVNCVELSRALRDLGHQIHVVCRPHSWASQQLLREPQLSVVECDLKRRADRLGAIARLAHQRQIDVVHTHMSSANFFGILLRRLYGIPCVVATAHNRNIQLHWMFNDRVIAVSEATRRYHQRVNRVRQSRIDVVHNFVNADRIVDSSGEERQSVRAQLGISPRAKLIGVIGDIGPRKGQIHLLRAMPRILQQVPTAHLVCAGYWRNGFRSWFTSEAAALGVTEQVTWSDVRHDVPRVLKSLDLFALPSLEENLPLTILEAMCCARPVVASRVGGIPECVIDGETGWLVPPGNVARLAEATVRTLRDRQLAARLGQAGYQRVVNEFSLASQVRRIERVLQRAVQQRLDERAAA